MTDRRYPGVTHSSEWPVLTHRVARVGGTFFWLVCCVLPI